MKYTEFEQFYDDVIRPFLIELEEDDGGFHVLVFHEGRRLRVFNYYQLKKEEIKKRYMAKSLEATLDRHKVASCMMYALLMAPLVEVKAHDESVPDYLLVANERLALNVAMNIIENYRTRIALNAVSQSRIQQSEVRIPYRLIEPPTFHDDKGRSEFIMNTCKGLHFIENKKFFDVFAYSTILFLLESRTDAVTGDDTAAYEST